MLRLLLQKRYVVCWYARVLCVPLVASVFRVFRALQALINPRTRLKTSDRELPHWPIYDCSHTRRAPPAVERSTSSFAVRHSSTTACTSSITSSETKSESRAPAAVVLRGVLISYQCSCLNGRVSSL